MGKSNMSLSFNNGVWEFVSENRTILLTPAEISFLAHSLERSAWEAEISLEIDSNEDNIDFSEVTKDELVDACLDELESKWELGTLNNEPDYQCVVFDVAQENGWWRD